MARDNGGPAFPSDEKTASGEHWMSHEGMTLRDWFAGQALAATAPNLTTEGMWPTNQMNEDVQAGNDAAINRAVSGAYRIADAMLSERNK